MLEFAINDQQYRAGKLNAFQQLHVSRKIAPILPRLLPAFAGLSAGNENLSTLAEALEPVAQALASMPDADCEFVFGTCLGVVSRQQGNSWSSVWNAQNKALMFDDIQLDVMTQLVVKVVADNLGPFMQGLIAKAQASSPVTA